MILVSGGEYMERASRERGTGLHLRDSDRRLKCSVPALCVPRGSQTVILRSPAVQIPGPKIVVRSSKTSSRDDRSEEDNVLVTQTGLGTSQKAEIDTERNS